MKKYECTYCGAVSVDAMPIHYDRCIWVVTDAPDKCVREIKIAEKARPVGNLCHEVSDTTR